MIRWYLLTMFALPLAELWDRWVSRFAQSLQPSGCFDAHRWFAVYEGAYRFGSYDRWARVWIVRIPWLRTWGPTFRNYDLAKQGFREHHLILCWQAPEGRRWRIEPPLPA